MATEENDSPRLALADSYDADADPHGELIRVQLEIAKIHRTHGSLADLARRTHRERELLIAPRVSDWTKAGGRPVCEGHTATRLRRGGYAGRRRARRYAGPSTPSSES